MWRVVLKLSGIVIITLCMLPFGWLVYLTGKMHWMQCFSQCYFSALAKVIGLRVHVAGALSKERPLLVVSNHISYLDIIALGAVAPLIFTPKSEIGGWPMIGFMCKLAGCVFIDRRRSQTNENLSRLHEGLKAGKPLSLFAEGTTGDGKRLLPIRSSYFQLVESFDGPIHIQPALLRYTHVHNLPLDEHSRYRICWLGDEDLLPHAIELLQLGPIDITIRFLPDLELGETKDRKALAAMCDAAMRGATHIAVSENIG